MDSSDQIHSVILDKDKCVGCTDCIKRCPTEAIRVKDGKAIITKERCIDCGLCISVCTHHAKKATTDNINIINNYKFKVASPAPTLYAQFKDVYDVNRILTGIKRLGFDDVFEVARAAEEVTKHSKALIDSGKLKKPVISSACPAILRLISIRFPSLIDNVLPIISPMEAAAKAARLYYQRQGIKDEDIGIFFISPCAAKVRNVRNPIEIDRSYVTGVISISDIYIKARHIIKNLKEDEIENLCQSRQSGVRWATIGGEGTLLKIDNAISVDGVENVMKVFELMENDQLSDVDFIEGLACTSGCLGGALAVENGFVAKNNLKKVEKNTKKYSPSQCRNIDFCYDEMDFRIKDIIKEAPAFNLDDDISVALKKMGRINEIYNITPKIDCGSCGAPTCMAFAEDVVQNKADLDDCIFIMRKKMKTLEEDEALGKMPEKEK